VAGFGTRPSGLTRAGWLLGGRLAALVGLLIPPASAAETSFAPTPLTVVDAGTVVEARDRDRWNRVVLRATPRFASGDVGEVAESIKSTVSSFTFVILATVQPAAPTDGPDAPRYRLAEVGVGYSMPVDGRLLVITPETRPAGVTLDFLGRQILTAKQKSLAEITCVGRTDTAVAFDAPTLMHRGNDHEELVVRHLVRVDPRSGDCFTCVWAVAAAADGILRPLEEPLRIVAGDTAEDRPIHVDGRRFTFGFPTKQAFAVEDLPPGRRLDWSTALRTAADQPTYTAQSVERLGTELDTAIASLRTLRAADRSRPAE